MEVFRLASRAAVMGSQFITGLEAQHRGLQEGLAATDAAGQTEALGIRAWSKNTKGKTDRSGPAQPAPVAPVTMGLPSKRASGHSNEENEDWLLDENQQVDPFNDNLEKLMLRFNRVQATRAAENVFSEEKVNKLVEPKLEEFHFKMDEMADKIREELSIALSKQQTRMKDLRETNQALQNQIDFINTDIKQKIDQLDTQTRKFVA